MNDKISELSNKLFQGVLGHEELRESVLLQLVGSMKILIVADSLTGTSGILNTVKNNFDYVNVIENFNEYIKNKAVPKGSVLAGAYPINGWFNPHIEIAQQIDISPTIINQFDILFIVRDMPNKERDEAIAESIFGRSYKEDEENLDDLKKEINEKRKIVVSWAQSAKRKLIDFYVNLRNFPHVSEQPPIPINSKRLILIKGMCESYAKLRDSKEVSADDVEKGINMCKFQLCIPNYDDGPEEKLNGKRKNINLLKEVFEDLENKLGILIPLEEIENAVNGKMNEEELKDNLDNLVKIGDLIKPREGFFERVSSYNEFQRQKNKYLEEIR